MHMCRTVSGPLGNAVLTLDLPVVSSVAADATVLAVPADLLTMRQRRGVQVGVQPALRARMLQAHTRATLHRRTRRERHSRRARLADRTLHLPERVRIIRALEAGDALLARSGAPLDRVRVQTELRGLVHQLHRTAVGHLRVVLVILLVLVVMVVIVIVVVIVVRANQHQDWERMEQQEGVAQGEEGNDQASIRATPFHRMGTAQPTMGEVDESRCREAADPCSPPQLQCVCRQAASPLLLRNQCEPSHVFH